jgi:hypothetical protein
MKRLLATLALFALCVVGYSLPARADYLNTPRWVVDNIKFINAAPVNSVASGFLTDSTTATGSAARLDTTAAFTLAEAAIPDRIPRAGTAIDSTDFLALYVGPTGNDLSTTADSIYLQTQVSFDGVTWVLVTPTISFQVANTVRPYGTGGFVLEANSTNWFARVYKMGWAATGQHITALVGTAPTDNQLWGYPLVRWIIGSANTGRYEAKVGHWTLRN